MPVPCHKARVPVAYHLHCHCCEKCYDEVYFGLCNGYRKLEQNRTCSKCYGNCAKHLKMSTSGRGEISRFRIEEEHG